MIVHGSVHGSMLPWCLSSLECFIVDLQLCQNHAAYFGNKEKKKSQNGCFKKPKHAKCSEKRTFLTTWYGHVRFSENLASLVFLKHQFWNSAFCLINDDLPVSCICSKNYLESPLKRACCLNILKHCSIFIWKPRIVSIKIYHENLTEFLQCC